MAIPSAISTIQQAKCDTYDLKRILRLCWQLNSKRKRDANGMSGELRIGSDLNLDSDSAHMKLIYFKASNQQNTARRKNNNKNITRKWNEKKSLYLIQNRKILET